MSTEQLTLVHAVRPPETDDDAPLKPPLLILLHGVRSNEQDLFALNPYLDERLVVVSTRAPITMGRNQYGWYNVVFHTDRIDRNEGEFEDSRKKLIQFISEAVAQYNVNPSRVYLMGFSQGSIMSLAVLLTEPELVAGVVVQSGSLPREVLPISVLPERLRDKPVMVVHGLYDDVLPIAEGRSIRDYLSRLPVQLDYREYPMRHQISDQSLDDVCGWLTAQLNRT